MGRKSKNTSIELRKLIIQLYKEGNTYRKIGKIVGKSYSTVEYIIKRYNEENRIHDKPKSGPKFILNQYDERWILRNIKENPHLSAPKLSILVEKHLGKNVSPETIRRVLRRHEYSGRAARKKPYVNKRNRKLRIEFARTLLRKPDSYWNDVIFCDECKINLFGSEDKKIVWRKKNQAVYYKNIIPTVKHGGGSVMIWACMSAKGVGNLTFVDSTMDQYVYIDILEKNLIQSARKMKIFKTFKFYQDNDPKHKARNVRLWLEKNCPTVIETPPQSPDLNVIENLWHKLKVNVHKHEISNIIELKSKIKEEWENIESSYCSKLVSSMPKRLREVIRSKGYPTKY